ncbi:MAG: ABC transporter ATP-binding protein [Alphaproteobacteria bacterium]|nr:ABC transporter ATP-binding protein [Alphaproteobacteria bacterium]
MKKTTVVSVKDLKKTYFMSGGLSQEVLKGVSFEIDAGNFVAIMGHSGSGKSTLMNTLGCLDRPTSGKYILAEKEVSKLSDDALASVRGQTLGFVFQNFNLLMKRTIADNVSLPLLYQGISKKECYERACQMIKKVGLDGYADRIPSQLSGGMQQRVAIARALINHPKIILADEPTGNLDSQTSDEIMGMFQELNDEGITIILVTHEPDVAMYAKRLIRIADGVVEYDGSVKDYFVKGNK